MENDLPIPLKIIFLSLFVRVDQPAFFIDKIDMIDQE